MTDFERGYQQGYADAMNWKTQNYLEHLPGREPDRQWVGLTDEELSGDHNLYQKWRESEAYAVPMTEDGVKRSQERRRGFNTGYKQAIKDAVDLLMIKHEAAKGAHNYWQVAANLVQADVASDKLSALKTLQTHGGIGNAY